MTTKEISEVCNTFSFKIMVVNELPKRGQIGNIYYVKDSDGDGFHQVMWSKKMHMRLRDWLLWRRYEWVCLGYTR